MRKYTQGNEKQLTQVTCNGCGKQLKVENGVVREGVCSPKIHWGYFSHKDGETHAFDLCEDCYDRLVASFCLPIAVEEEKEML